MEVCMVGGWDPILYPLFSPCGAGSTNPSLSVISQSGCSFHTVRDVGSSTCTGSWRVASLIRSDGWRHENAMKLVKKDKKILLISTYFFRSEEIECEERARIPLLWDP